MQGSNAAIFSCLKFKRQQCGCSLNVLDVTELVLQDEISLQVAFFVVVVVVGGYVLVYGLLEIIGEVTVSRYN